MQVYTLRVLWRWLAPILFVASPALAQVGGGAVTGLVTDPAGAPVPGVTVTVTDPGTKRARRTQTDSQGRYVVGGLASARYQLDAALDGFRPLARHGVRVATGETLRLDLQLSLGATEAVTVTDEAGMLRPETSGLGQVIDSQTVTALPLNGRSFITLTGLGPGVALPPGSSLPRINGGRPRTNEYLFDGISVLQPEPGQVAFFPNVDAIQDFKIESNSPPAEFGRFNGGVVNLTTKSGSNDVRGSAFGFFRHEALNARHYFARSTGEKPAFRRQQFGGVVGGPVRRERTFFFADFQGQRQRITRSVISTVPTLLQREGIFTEPVAGRVPLIFDPATGTAARTPFAGNQIPLGRIDPVARTLVQRYPLPTSAGTANNYRRVADETVNHDQVSARLDHRFRAGPDHVFGRLTRFAEAAVPVAPLPDGSGVASGTLGPQSTGAWAFASSYQRVFSTRLMNELRVGDTRRTVRRHATELEGAVSAVLGLPGIPSSARFPNTLPAFLIAGYQQLGAPPNTASDFSTSVSQVANTLAWVGGRHTVKAGADLRWQRLDIIQPPSPTGAFTFSSLFTDQPGVADTGTPLASFLLGQVQQFSIDLQQGEIRNRAHFQEYFVQDDWRASERVTLNAGLRYTLNFPSTELDNQAAVFNLETRQLEFLGRDGQPRAARQLHKLNFGPRFGVAGLLTPRTVVRAGYGLVWIEMTGITTPFTTPVFPFLQTVSQRTLDNLAPAFTLAEGPSVAPVPLTPSAGVGQGVFAVDRNLGSGYVQQWNASLQRELSPNLSIEAAYTGSIITHVGIPDSNLNQLNVAQLAQGASLLERVPNPFFGAIPRSSSLGDPTIPRAQLLRPYPQYTTVSLYRNNVGTTHYHGAYLKLEQRFSHGLSYLISYTRSRLTDDASSVFDASILAGPVANYPVADSFNRRLERDYSTGDIPQVFAASGVWALPSRAGGWRGALANGWTLSGVLTLQSGVPVAVTQATNHNAFAGFGTQRPNLVGDPRLPPAERSVSRWFNTAAFATAPQFTLGSSSRNPVRGPAYRNVDVAVVRRVPLAAGPALEARVEAFNLTNTPAFGAPNGVLGSAAFGTITTAGDPRVIQLAVKLLF